MLCVLLAAAPEVPVWERVMRWRTPARPRAPTATAIFLFAAGTGVVLPRKIVVAVRCRRSVLCQLQNRPPHAWTVYCMDGATFSVEVPEDTRVAEVKRTIGALCEVPHNAMELFVKGGPSALIWLV